MRAGGSPRPRLAVYWASACGGCQAAFLDLGEDLLALEERFEIVLFPLLVDFTEDDLEALSPGDIDLCLVSGGMRNDHDLRVAGRLRELSRFMVALGACAHLGSVLGLANTGTVEELLEAVYGPGGPVPRGSTTAGGEVLSLPESLPRIRPLGEVMPVDFVIPGCPPERRTLAAALGLLEAVARGEMEAPPRGSVLGASDVALCEECPRERPTGPLETLRRLHEVDPVPDRCLLDQGLLCLGPATRGGCGAVCIEAGAGCRGCYGPLEGVSDQGARMLGALVALGGPRSFEEVAAGEEAEALADSVADPVGSLYRFSFAASLLDRLVPGKEGTS